MTPRQKQIIELISKGMSSREVAYRLGILKRTVDFHLLNLYDTLNVSNRIQALKKLGYIK